MTLTGFNKTCANKSGGVQSISLAMASEIANITFDAASGSYSAVNFKDGGVFAEYQFREKGASLSEKATWESGSMLVRHSLSFSIDPSDALSAQVVEQIALASRRGGMIALVVTNAGETILVGYSELFKTQRALTLSESVSGTGSIRTDDSVRTIVLQTYDCALSLPYTGTIP